MSADEHPDGLTCLIADDHPAILTAASRVLTDHGVTVIGTASRGDEALEKIERRRPAVAVVDLRMDGIDGIELTRRLRRAAPATSVLIYTGVGRRADVDEALAAGAGGFILKDAPLTELVRAVRSVAGGHTYVDAVLAGRIASHAHEDGRAVLTPRETEVLRHLANGLRAEEIGAELHLSPLTVQTHVRKAMARLGARTRTQAVAEALRQGLIS